MIDIHHLLRSPNGTQEDFELALETKLFDVSLTQAVRVKGNLTRIKEGIVCRIENLETEESVHCVCCEKLLKLPIHVEESEWIFYEHPVQDNPDIEGVLRIDLGTLTVDPVEAIRQELWLHHHEAPRCEPPCREFAEPQKGTKALAGLKNLKLK